MEEPLTDEERFARARLRELAFEQVSNGYSQDARKDFWRSSAYALVASVMVITGAVLGSVSVATGDGELARGIAIGTLIAVASAPFWWQAERNRRSAVEHRRLSRHLRSIEPYLSAFEGCPNTVIRSALGQRVFARPEGSDLLAATSWPTAEELARTDREKTVQPGTLRRVRELLSELCAHDRAG